MLKRLRLQLTFLYILAAVGLVALTTFSTYSLLEYYFQRETDLALNYKMATLFAQYGLALPPELTQARQSWQSSQSYWSPGAANIRQTPDVIKPEYEVGHEGEEGEGEGEEGGERAQSLIHLWDGGEESEEERYDARLSSIFVLPIDVNGQVIVSPYLAQPPFDQNEGATQAALKEGHDLRTVRTSNGVRVRLLTYRLDNQNGPLLLQIGRTLTDQDRMRRGVLLGLLSFGFMSCLLLGFGSWWMSGKSIGPAQKAWERQRSFVSNASHELRTPLTLMRASAEVSLRSQTDGGQQQLLSDILGECDYMNRLVDDLLLLSRLDADQLKLSREPISLHDLLTDTVNQARKLITGKNILLEIGQDKGVVWGDAVRLRQVLLVLLDNAIRFTPHGGKIRIEALQRRKTCLITVSDNGKGIAPEHLPRLFERFYQANPTGETSNRNNGLGLAIAKGIVDAHGGEIRVESQAGKGTSFFVELPYYKPAD